MLTDKQISLCQAGVARLKEPILPLVRLAGMLYLTGPFPTLNDLLEELKEPLETGGVHFENPQELLQDFLDDMRPFERMKNPQEPSRIILDENMQAADQFQALHSWVAQNVLTRELETINSLLCAPCGCTLCCTGPSSDMSQEFFEIPLTGEEAAHFDLPKIDDEKSRSALSGDEPPFSQNGTPFFRNPPSLYHWQNGWSMILPPLNRCPNLDPDSGGCRIYPKRPDVCRRPQIFPYMLERQPDHDAEFDGRLLPAFVIHRKILAIWDCPYVQQFQDEIGQYAQLCDMEPIFKENKS